MSRMGEVLDLLGIEDYSVSGQEYDLYEGDMIIKGSESFKVDSRGLWPWSSADNSIETDG